MTLIGRTRPKRVLTTKGTKRTEKKIKVVALPDETACEKFAMGLSIVIKDWAPQVAPAGRDQYWRFAFMPKKRGTKCFFKKSSFF